MRMHMSAHVAFCLEFMQTLIHDESQTINQQITSDDDDLPPHSRVTISTARQIMEHEVATNLPIQSKNPFHNRFPLQWTQNGDEYDCPMLGDTWRRNRRDRSQFFLLFYCIQVDVTGNLIPSLLTLLTLYDTYVQLFSFSKTREMIIHDSKLFPPDPTIAQYDTARANHLRRFWQSRHGIVKYNPFF